MIVKLLTKRHLEFLSLPGGCTGLSVSTLVQIPHCWKSHDAAHLSSLPLRKCGLENNAKTSINIKRSLT